MKIMVGVEKESLVFDDELKPIDIDIENLKDELTVDFANHQLEVVTNPVNSGLFVSESLKVLLNDKYLEGKNIWPLSTPLKENENVKYDKLDKDYRKKLYEKYGLEKMLYSGIHYNYSNDVLKSKQEYFQLIQKVYEYMPIIMQFTSFSPFAHKEQDGLEKIGKNFGFEDSLSLRASSLYGYSNDKGVEIDFSNYENYLKSIQSTLDSGKINDEREIYSKVRLKNNGDANYIELRFLDLNPFLITGISDEVLVLIEVWLNYLTGIKLETFNQKEKFNEIDEVALHGQNRSKIYKINGQKDTLYNHTISLLDALIEANQVNTYDQMLNDLKLKYQNKQLDFDIMVDTIESRNISLEQFGLENMGKPVKFKSLYPELDMELSTKLLMQSAQRNGYLVDVESESQNIIKISSNEKSEYVIQATKTNLDGYANILLMENKFMTKKILSEYNINVPKGILLKRGEQLQETFESKVVVKPLDTNFGLGISICDGDDAQALEHSIKYAFNYSDEIIIEEYISGEEYRFLVIDGVVESIVTRKNANVIGDGVNNIEQLIDIKNQSELRSVGYKTPLEKIKIDDDLKRVVANQGFNLKTIVPVAHKVTLRDTSNVSQGGDSHEVFDIIPSFYKQEAANAAKALGVKICGVDMIIDQQTKEFAIIEVNFNPAIHMHMYPYSGKSRDVATKILEVLFKDKKGDVC